MLTFFRKIRKSLIGSGSAQKYFIYAIGEIALIVIGILIALQINNWNTKKVAQNQFEVSLEQLYKSLVVDTLLSDAIMDSNQFQLNMIDSLLDGGEGIPRRRLPHIIYSLDYYGHNMVNIQINQDTRTSFINYNPNNEFQNRLSDLLIRYMSHVESSVGKKNGNELSLKIDTDPLLIKHLRQLHIPMSPYSKGMSFEDWYNYIDTLDVIQYTQEQVDQVHQLLDDLAFQSDLRSLRERKFFVSMTAINSNIAKNILELIESEYPDIVITHKTMNIIGSATEYRDWSTDVEMNALDHFGNKWEKEVTLHDGFIKFRTDEVWSFNWGSGHVRKGDMVFDGPNIPVKAGRYLVRIDLEENNFKFEPLDD